MIRHEIMGYDVQIGIRTDDRAHSTVVTLIFEGEYEFHMQYSNEMLMEHDREGSNTVLRKAVDHVVHLIDTRQVDPLWFIRLKRQRERQRAFPTIYPEQLRICQDGSKPRW